MQCALNDTIRHKCTSFLPDGGDQSIEHATALANMMADEIEKSATSSSVKEDAGIKIAPASISDEAPIDYSELDEDALDDDSPEEAKAELDNMKLPKTGDNNGPQSLDAAVHDFKVNSHCCFPGARVAFSGMMSVRLGSNGRTRRTGLLP